MANATQTIRLCVGRLSSVPLLYPRTVLAATTTTSCSQLRSFSSTGRKHGNDDSAGNTEGKKSKLTTERVKSPSLKQVREAAVKMLPPQDAERVMRATTSVRREYLAVKKLPSRGTQSWNEFEIDTTMWVDDTEEDLPTTKSDISIQAHSKLDEMREMRHYARLVAWDMPLLAKLAKSFEPPTTDMSLRFRYTTYMGEFHPAEKKVVVQFCPADLGLTEVQEEKLIKLVGPRFNPETEIVHMSCEQFEHQAQNKRYLGDLVEGLIAAAKDPSDTFEDVPFDTRHHMSSKHKPSFPKEWRMSEERRRELQELRAQAFLRDQQRVADGAVVDGIQRIANVLSPSSPTIKNTASLYSPTRP